jgi:hypothetical protein
MAEASAAAVSEAGGLVAEASAAEEAEEAAAVAQGEDSN